MSITYTIDHAASSVEDVSIEVAAKSEMTLRRVYTDQKSGELRAEYVLASGEPKYPATVTYFTAVEKLGSSPTRRSGMIFETWAVATPSTSDDVTRKKISYKHEFVVPGDMVLELADLDDLMGNGFSFMYPSVTTKVRSTAWLQDLLFGVVAVV